MRVNQNLRLDTLGEEHLLELLDMRNLFHIRSKMIHQEIITLHEHKKWFAQLSNSQSDIYWSIIYLDRFIGLTHIKSVNWGKSEGETGIFIGDEDYYSKGIAFEVMKTVLSYGFLELNLDTIKIKVLKSNARSIKFFDKLRFNFLNSLNDDVKEDKVSILFGYLKKEYFLDTAELNKNNTI